MEDKELLSSLIILLDPLQLLDFSCPIDEYNSEVNKVYEFYINGNYDYKIIGNTLFGLFNFSFEKCMFLADLFNILKTKEDKKLFYKIKLLFNIWDPLARIDLSFDTHNYDEYIKEIIDIVTFKKEINSKNINLSFFNQYKPRKEVLDSLIMILEKIFMNSECKC